jgi:hypothetical protein
MPKKSKESSNRNWAAKIKRFIYRLTPGLTVIGLATLLFVLRNKSAFQNPNFFAEDAKVFYNNIFLHPLTAAGTLFNGYLVIGQYLLAYIALIPMYLFGGNVASLAAWTAAITCLFLGVTVSLPFLLFRRQLGNLLSLAAVGVSALVPLASSSYFVIGSIANLKFAFLYIAFLLIIYRSYNLDSHRKPYLIDAGLLLCVLTNATVLFLLPFALWPYRKTIILSLRRFRPMRLVRDKGLASALVTSAVSLLYVAAVYVRGIPPLHGYLDSPYQWQATVPIADRTTIYTWLYPINSMLRDRLTITILAILFAAWWIYRKKDRLVLVLAVWAIASSTILFVMNRTGVSAYYLNYTSGGPDQFFYAQNMVFIFLSFWLIREWFRKKEVVAKLFLILGLLIFMIWAIPYGTSFSGAKIAYANLGTAQHDIQKACAIKKDKVVHIQIYPTSDWKWNIERGKVCKD